MKYLLFLHFPLYTVSIACYYNSKHMFCLEVNGMEEHHTQIGELSVANIPIQMLAITDRNGKLTPLWFRSIGLKRLQSKKPYPGTKATVRESGRKNSSAQPSLGRNGGSWKYGIISRARSGESSGSCHDAV